MSAKQRLQRRRTMLKQNKLHNIAQLLELPAMATPPAHYYTITAPSYINLGSGKPHLVSPSSSQDSGQTGGERTGFESRDRADAFTTISGPEDCWSPSANQNKPRTTSQAQALAQVLEQSPPPGVAETRVSDDTSEQRSRSISVEEAEEALDMESRNGQNPLLARVLEQESISDSSSSEPSSRRESIDNLKQLRFIKSKSHSAPPTPRGGRHYPPLDSFGFGDNNLLSTSPCLSDPAFYMIQGLEQLSNKASSEHKKTKSNGKRTNRKHKGHGRRRTTK